MNREIKIENFLNKEVVNFASYSTLRAIGSVVDGLKNSHRKIIFGMKSTNKSTKVSILSAEIMAKSQYLHGDISGSIITLAKNYTTTNNLPLLTREGNFGTRMTPEASATRYIFTNKEKIFNEIFKPQDDVILEAQSFEGENIEPKFYTPTLPLILINGSEGISTGFAQKILPRKLDTIKKYIVSYFENKELPELVPYYNGFKGIIKKGASKNQWIIEGTFEKISSTKILINELPIGYSLQSYTKVLDTLEEEKVIKRYVDKSNAKKDIFEFEVTMDMKSLKEPENVIKEKLKLIKKVTENFTVIDENNRVIIYDSPEEVLNHYIKIKLEYLEKRKNYLAQKIKEDLIILYSKYLFVKNVIEENIVVQGTKKDEIIKQIQKIEKIIKIDDSYDYLLRMPIYNLTEEKSKELLESIKVKKEELKNTIESKIEDIWLKEIDECFRIQKM